MADLYWIGEEDDDASNADNWRVTSYSGSVATAAPTTGDTAHLGWYSQNNCNWDISAVDRIEMDIDSTDLDLYYQGTLTFTTNVALNGLIANGELKHTVAKEVTFSGTPPYNGRYIKNGKYAKYIGPTYLSYKFSGGDFFNLHLETH